MLIVLRVLAGLCLLIAALAGIYDGTRSMAADRFVTTSLLDQWSYIAPALLASAKAAVQGTLGAAAWNQGVVPLLRLPTWGVFGGLGLLIAYAGRRRRRVNVFAN